MLAAVGLAIAFSFRAAPLGGVSVRRASVHATATSDVVAPPPTTKCKPYDPAVQWKPDGAVDEAAMLAKWSETYPIAPDELVNRAKWVIAEPRIGLVDDSCLSPDFEFCAPFIGPLNKDKFIEALSNFQLQEAFPDINDQYHAFRADPFQPGRVWWNTRTRASHTGAATKMMGEPTGKELEFPPQSFSLIFDKEGLVKEITVGYVNDRRVGNTGGLGGAFGYFWAIGKPLPIPECRPYKPSKALRLLGWIGRQTDRIKALRGGGDN